LAVQDLVADIRRTIITRARKIEDIPHKLLQGIFYLKCFRATTQKVVQQQQEDPESSRRSRRRSSKRNRKKKRRSRRGPASRAGREKQHKRAEYLFEKLCKPK